MQSTGERTSRCARYIGGARAHSSLLAALNLIIVSNKTFNLRCNSHLCLFSNEPVCPFLFQVQIILGVSSPQVALYGFPVNFPPLVPPATLWLNCCIAQFVRTFSWILPNTHICCLVSGVKQRSSPAQHEYNFEHSQVPQLQLQQSAFALRNTLTKGII